MDENKKIVESIHIKRRHILAYKELEDDELIEIDSVSSFISAVKELQDSADGSSTEL